MLGYCWVVSEWLLTHVPMLMAWDVNRATSAIIATGI
jgi:hypothetical protein